MSRTQLNDRTHEPVVSAADVLDWIRHNVPVEQLREDRDDASVPEDKLPLAAALWFVAMAEAAELQKLDVKEIAVYLADDDGFPTYTCVEDLQAWLDDYVDQQLKENGSNTRAIQHLLYTQLARFFTEQE